MDQHGRPLAWSLDCRELSLHGPTLAAITELLWPAVAVYEPDIVAGPTLSADPLVSALLLAAQERGVALEGGLLRPEPKAYGLRKVLEGPAITPGARAVVVDDIFMRGRAAARAVEVLRRHGAFPVAVVTLVDLERIDSERVDGISYSSVFTATELGLSPFREPPLSGQRGSTLPGVASPIPTSDAVPPVVTRDTAVISGDRGGLVAYAQSQGGWRRVGEPALCQAAWQDLLVVGDGVTVTALDLSSLRVRWKVALPAIAIHAEASDVFLGVADGGLVRLDASSGTVIQRRQLVSPAKALHQVDGMLLAVTGRELLALRQSFALRWSRTGAARSPVGSHDRLYVLTPGPSLTRLNCDDGSEVWSRPVGPRTLPRLVPTGRGVALAVESVVVSYSDTSAVEWVHSGPRRMTAGPVACGPDGLAIADRGGVVRVLRIEDGAHLASYLSLPVRPVALAASTRVIAAVGVNGEAWAVDRHSQP